MTNLSAWLLILIAALAYAVLIAFLILIDGPFQAFDAWLSSLILDPFYRDLVTCLVPVSALLVLLGIGAAYMEQRERDE